VHMAPGWVNGDPTRLEQIATNLIDNALKYTPSGGAIDIHVEADDAAGQIVMRVADSGCGIAADLLPHVFDVFVQGSITLDRAQGGLGIGLALVRRLVELHGGTVGAVSEGTGHGSVFEIRLPQAEPVSATPAPEVHTVEATASTVLLIEDNDDGREMMATMLDAYGYAVLQAADGLQGVQMALEKRPDVALVDIGLPGIDGYEVARRLRADAASRHLKLIALTGYGLADDQRRVLEAGFDMHLVKPVDIDLLLEAIGSSAQSDTALSALEKS
jgi:CheY-like chemotaxis protein